MWRGVTGGRHAEFIFGGKVVTALAPRQPDGGVRVVAVAAVGHREGAVTADGDPHGGGLPGVWVGVGDVEDVGLALAIAGGVEAASG